MVINDSIVACSDIVFNAKERRDEEHSADFSASIIDERAAKKDDLSPGQLISVDVLNTDN